jgi:hypothetical protein
VTTTLLFGELRTGRITDTIDATGCSWAQVANDAGSISSVTVHGHEVRRKQLRTAAAATRTFLAVDLDGRLQEAGPLWSRSWDDKAWQLTLGAAGLWSLFDHRKVLPVLAAAQRAQDEASDTIVSGTDLGGIARALVAQAMTHLGGNLPLVLPPAAVGVRTETFPGYSLLWVGDQIRQLTKRADAAPDIRFLPRYTSDKLGIEWALQTGSENAPLLTQLGDDWYFDKTVPKSPVKNINTDEDATVMGMRGWFTGNGQERDIIIGTAFDQALIDEGFPLLEVGESDSNVIEQATADDHAANLVQRSARPPEVWKLDVEAFAAAEVLAGDYARVKVADGHPWLAGGESRMRVKSKSGDLSTKVTLTMYPVQAVI